MTTTFKSWAKIRASFNEDISVEEMTKIVNDYFTRSYMSVTIDDAYPASKEFLATINFQVNADDMDDIDIALYDFDTKENVSYDMVAEYEDLTDND